MPYKAIVIGSSAGGFYALKRLLSQLDDSIKLPILIVQHLSASSDNYMARYLNSICNIIVKEADEKEDIVAGTAYIAPPNYHMLIEDDHTISLSTEEKVNYSRPSIDVLFQSASFVYQNELVGIVLTGANSDGAIGLKFISNNDGLCIVQNPNEAESQAMPLAALANVEDSKVLTIDEIAALISRL